MNEKHISLDGLKEYNKKLKETYIEPLNTSVEELENKLVKDTLVIEDTYNSRTTAKGGEFLSGSKVTLNSAIGDSKVIKDIVNEDGSVTPACKNLFNLAGMTFTAQTPSNFNISNTKNGLTIQCLTSSGVNYFSSTDVDCLHLKSNTTYASYAKFSMAFEQNLASDSMQGSLWLQTNDSWDSTNRICIAGLGSKYEWTPGEYIAFSHFTTPADLSAYKNVTSCMRGIVAITFKEVMIIEDNDNIYNADNFPEYHPYFTTPCILHTKFAGIESKNTDGTGISTLNFPSTDFKWGMTVDFDNKKIIDQGADIVLTGEETGIKYYYYNGHNGLYISNFTYPGNKAVADFICTHAEKTSSGRDSGNMWCGYNNSRSFMWIGILDILGYTTQGTQLASTEEAAAVEYIRQYLRDQAAAGTPVTVRYLTKEAREIPFSGSQAAMDNTYTAWTNGTEKVLGNYSYEYGLINNLTQTYLLNDSLIDRIDTAEKIAKGASKAISFANYIEMINAFNGLSNDKYNIGQNIMIVTHGVPDLWVAGISDISISYNYTSDEEFVNKLSTNGTIQVGYYILSDLETQKLYDDDYAKKTDLDTKADEWNGAAGGYATLRYRLHTNSGENTGTLKVYNKPLNSAIPQFSTSGTLKTNTPTENLDCVNKEYLESVLANAGSGGSYYEKVDGINIGDNFVKGIISSNGIFTSDSLQTGLYGDELWLKDKAGTSPNKVYASISYDGTDDKLKYTGNPSIANHNLATEEYVDNMVANAGGGGTKLYKHDLLIMGGGARIYPTIISSFATMISNYEDLAQAVQKGFVAYASGSSDGISTDIRAGTLTVGSASIDLLSYVDNKNISISITGATIMDGVPIEL